MRKDIHPENYRLVAFKDMSNDDVFITKSTAETKETLTLEGVEYPLVKLEISRTSHPYYTGKAKLVDTAGRIDKFKSKYDKFKKSSSAKAAEDTVSSAKAAEDTASSAKAAEDTVSSAKAAEDTVSSAKAKEEVPAAAKAPEVNVSAVAETPKPRAEETKAGDEEE
ncbi:MAG TPA: type B 50S ribosomal protein L31 [Eudoraea sp.]|nr:type B 50S ribosomal protein L31 [Eudoraea sp.]